MKNYKKINCKKSIKSEKGSITLFVLIAMIFFLTTAITIYITNMNKSISQQQDIKKIQNRYNDIEDINMIYQEQKEKMNLQ